MKLVKLIIALLLVGAAGVGNNAWANHRHHGHHSHFRVFVGPVWAPVWGPAYYPRYYSPPLVIERPSPQVYIEQQPAVAPPPGADAGNYWYYCPAAKAYYPYVQACPGGWQKVLPQPPQ
ncbi:hypothetical protein [Sulfuritalea sp.]|uniref:hypothetical protein n=1 Tax=Sulfuritalea sp. TaxID=2480090 RepID=UPI00286E3E16|nr:hypothetical protein [Sulfuritalea sp.]